MLDHTFFISWEHRIVSFGFMMVLFMLGMYRRTRDLRVWIVGIQLMIVGGGSALALQQVAGSNELMNRKKEVMILAILLGVVAVGIGGLWWLMRSTYPYTAILAAPAALLFHMALAAFAERYYMSFGDHHLLLFMAQGVGLASLVAGIVALWQLVRHWNATQ